MKIAVKPLTTRYVLVDYDNLNKDSIDSESKIGSVVTHVFNRLKAKSDFFENAKSLEDVEIRLYGGWYKEKKLDILAQRLQAEIHSYAWNSYNATALIKVNLRVTLALAMLCCKESSLFATCRTRALVDRDGVEDVSCCEPAEPHYEYLRHVLNIHKCPHCGRNDLYNCFTARTQKMVDAMLFCDALLLAEDGNRVALVSSDADMIPVLIHLSRSGKRVYHVLTGAEGDMSYYTPLFGKDYSMVTWED